MNVSELFYSIQGEGRLAGVPSVFVRLAGCDLQCRWCDTPYAQRSEQGEPMTVSHVLADVLKYNCRHVVVTGGEPLLTLDLPDLLTALSREGKHITLETSATQFRDITCDLVSISPKLSNSLPLGTDNLHYKESIAGVSPAPIEDADGTSAVQGKCRLNISAIRNYIDHYDYQLKFVVENEIDLPEIEQVLRQLQNNEKNGEINRNNVFLMPQAQTRKQHSRLGPRIVQMCLEKGFRYCPRLQIELWDNQRKR